MSAFETTRSTNGFSLLNPFATFFRCCDCAVELTPVRRARPCGSCLIVNLTTSRCSRGDIEFVASHG